MYEYSKSVKSSVSDELINTYLLRPLAGLVVRALYRTRVTPNQVTVASTIAGLIAAFVYLNNAPLTVACAGLLVTAKDVLDSADGQLARAKEQFSRRGRFLDSIGDFVVNVALFASIGYVLSTNDGSFAYTILALMGLTGTTFRVSYHVYYQASFLHLEDMYQTNRISEEVRDEDKNGDRTALRLQRVFQAIYGWQDNLVLRMDKWCMGGQSGDEVQKRWYSDIAGIRLSGFLGMGTELFLLTVCSLLNELALYLYLNAVLMNGILVINILYRRFLLRKRLVPRG